MGRRWRTLTLVVAAAAILAVFAGRRLRAPGGADESRPAATGVAVHAGEIRKATLHRYVTAYGRVIPQPPGQGTPPARVTIGSSASGLLVGIDCAQGQRIRAGDTLFSLDSRVAEVELGRAKEALDFAEKTYERQKALMDVDGTSRRALLEAEQRRDAARADLSAAETQLALLRIASPVSGTVVRIDAHLGQSVEPNTVLAEVIDLDRLVVEAGVPSREAALLRTGQPVSFGSEDAAGGAPGGRLIFIGTDVDPGTDTVPIRASLPTGADLAPGRFVELRIVAEERPECLTVPRVAVVSRAGEGTWIEVIRNDQAVRVPVTTGLEEGDRVEVTGEGLQEGTPIVTEEAYSLPEGTKIRILGG